MAIFTNHISFLKLKTIIIKRVKIMFIYFRATIEENYGLPFNEDKMFTEQESFSMK